MLKASSGVRPSGSAKFRFTNSSIVEILEALSSRNDAELRGDRRVPIGDLPAADRQRRRTALPCRDGDRTHRHASGGDEAPKLGVRVDLDDLASGDTPVASLPPLADRGHVLEDGGQSLRIRDGVELDELDGPDLKLVAWPATPRPGVFASSVVWPGKPVTRSRRTSASHIRPAATYRCMTETWPSVSRKPCDARWTPSSVRAMGRSVGYGGRTSTVLKSDFGRDDRVEGRDRRSAVTASEKEADAQRSHRRGRGVLAVIQSGSLVRLQPSTLPDPFVRIVDAEPKTTARLEHQNMFRKRLTDWRMRRNRDIRADNSGAMVSSVM